MTRQPSLYEALLEIYQANNHLTKIAETAASPAASQGKGSDEIKLPKKEQFNVDSKILGAILGMALANYFGAPSGREWNEDPGSARLKQILASLLGGGGGYLLGPTAAGMSSALYNTLTGGGEGNSSSKAAGNTVTIDFSKLPSGMQQQLQDSLKSLLPQ